MKRLVTYNITESDMEWTLFYTRDSVHDAFRPLAAELARQYSSSDSRPYCVAIGGPPGCGKSAVAAVLKRLISEAGVTTEVLPLDGFHLKNEVLKSRHTSLDGNLVSLYALKGAKETYDTERLKSSLNRLRAGDRFHWPSYSRITHEPSYEGFLIENLNTLYLIEGNYLLLQEEPWNSLRSFFDRALHIYSREQLLRKRIISRKMRGGYSGRDARVHYRQCDRRNIRDVLQGSGGWDYQLRHTRKFRYELELW